MPAQRQQRKQDSHAYFNLRLHRSKSHANTARYAARGSVCHQDSSLEKHQCFFKLLSIHKTAALLTRNMHVFILLGVLLLTIGIMHAAAPVNRNVIDSEKNSVFESPFAYSINNSPFVPVSLPCSLRLPANTRIVLKNQLPAVLIKGATVLLRTSQQDVAVYVDNKYIYSSYNPDTMVPAPSSAYHFVRLPTDCAGKQITIELTSPFANYTGFMNQIYLGSKASNLFFLFHKHGFRFIMGFLVFSIGFLLMLLFLLAKGQENKAAAVYLNAFFVCAGYWVMAESKLVQFFISYPMGVTNASIFALALLPVFSGLYYYSTHIKVYKKAGKAVIAAVSAVAALLAVAACLNPMLPLRAFAYLLGFIGLYVLVMVTSVAVESVKSGKFFSTSVIGLLLFSICCLIELIVYLSNITNYNESNFLILGLFLFCLAMVGDSLQSFTRVYQTAIKVDTLSVLAYTDSLTGLKNRTAFLERMSTIDMQAKKMVSLAMFDVNDLKHVNDTFGHLVGDALLRHSAKAILRSLRQEDEVYRIGGDEFVAIIFHDQAFDLNRIQNTLTNVLTHENQKTLTYHLSIAYGAATFCLETDKTLFETLSKADERMYACKKTQKDANPLVSAVPI